ncbi:hypothetical protein C8Q75DRAFT_785262 [Abortiporus biennis]|nr:hypothetical protein C8Q75DRAFT_785262 [Abortiporus biennis]
MMHNEMVLNFDVLFVVLSFIDFRSGILSMMKTCRTLYNAGIPFLFKPRISFDRDEITIRKQQILWKQIHENPSFANYIEKIDIDVEYIATTRHYSRTVKIMNAILHRCQGLRKLRLEGLEPRGYEPENYLPKMFSSKLSFKCLRSLTIERIGSDAYILLQGLTAPLVYLSISYSLGFGDHPIVLDALGENRPRDPVPLLTKFSTTLEEVSVEWGDWRWIPEVTLNSGQCLLVHTFRVGYEVSTTEIAAIIYVFPNLRKFHIADETRGVMEETTLFNIESQRSLRELGVYMWKELEEVTSYVDVLFCLSPLVKVHNLELYHSRARDTRWSKAAVEGIRPAILRTNLNSPHKVFRDFAADVGGLFSYPELETLSLELLYWGYDNKSDEDEFSELDVAESILGLLGALRTSSMTSLHLAIRWHVPEHLHLITEPTTSEDDSDSPDDTIPRKRKEKLRSPTPPLPEDHVRNYFEPNRISVMKKIADTVPSLTQLLFQMLPSGLGDHESSLHGWKISHFDEGHEVEDLLQEQCEVFLERIGRTRPSH